MSRRVAGRIGLPVALLALLPLAGSLPPPAPAPAAQAGRPGVRPKIRTMEVVPLPGPNPQRLVQVEATFERPPDPGRPVRVAPGGRSIPLSDDGRGGDRAAGDGIFSARVPVAPAMLRFLRKRGGVERVGPDASFRGRQRVGARDPGLTRATEIGRSLIITDLGVIEDPLRTYDPYTKRGNPKGVWTFGHLMTRLARSTGHDVHPALFTLKWLESWERDQLVNGFPVPARPAVRQQIIQDWNATTGHGKILDVDLAPFRLMAIVNRLDLRDNLLFGEGSAGEGRFIFCPIDVETGRPLPFTVIFEFVIVRADFAGVEQWARSWHALKDPRLRIGGEYNRALERLTDQFFAPAGADQAALVQVRTSDAALAQPLDLREFRLNRANGQLEIFPVAWNPDPAWNRTPVLARYIDENLALILDNDHEIPGQFAGRPFLGGAAPSPDGFFWDGPPGHTVQDAPHIEARHKLSLSTCNGCHGADAFPAGTPGAARFHVVPREAGRPSALSGFMTGGGVGGFQIPDPAVGTVVRTFSDLERRAEDLDGLLQLGSDYELGRAPLNMSH